MLNKLDKLKKKLVQGETSAYFFLILRRIVFLSKQNSKHPSIWNNLVRVFL